MGHLHDKRRARAPARAFTLLELLVATTVLLVLLGMILTITGNTGTAVSRATAHLDAFATARSAFDLMSHRIGQAVLNPYYEYFDARGRPPSDSFYGSTGTLFVPAHYGRHSDLQFLVRQNTQMPGYGQELFFAAPLTYTTGKDARATPGLLNACAFFVQYGGSDDFLPATMTTTRARYRLMQAVQPAERLQIYDGTAQGTEYWMTDIANAGTKLSRCVSPLADNVLVLTVWPRLAETDDADGSQLTADYTYDSHPSGAAAPAPSQPATANQLPPLVQVTMVVLSEASAVRLGGLPGHPPDATENSLLNPDGSHKFGVSTTAQHRADLNDLAARLTKQRVDFEIFTTTVPMRESHWGIQTNP